ncbi:MAG: decaprenyl-phosphate phosphoribosyltransferase [Myxococcota bacterium]
MSEAAARRTPASIAVAAIKQLRPKQWAKNVFVFPALVFSGQFLDPESVGLAVVAAIVFSLLASSGYVLNDYLDREADRKHPKKKFRPIASGALPIPAAWALMATCVVVALGLGAWLSLPFVAIAVVYLATTLSYSFYFKHRVILDVMFLAACYVWRVIAGAVAIQVHVSPWLFLCAAFLALFLGFNKRRAELLKLGKEGGTRKNLQYYSREMLVELQSIVTASVVICYALYTVQGHNGWMVITIPFVLYGVFRYIYLVDRGAGDAPDETVVSDWPFILNGLLYIVVAVAVIVADGRDLLPVLLLDAP